MIPSPWNYRDGTWLSNVNSSKRNSNNHSTGIRSIIELSFVTWLDLLRDKTTVPASKLEAHPWAAPVLHFHGNYGTSFFNLRMINTISVSGERRDLITYPKHKSFLNIAKTKKCRNIVCTLWSYVPNTWTELNYRPWTVTLLETRSWASIATASFTFVQSILLCCYVH